MIKMSDNGIEVDLISQNKLDGKPINEKISEILDRVQENKIVIVEGGLTPEEESKLIEKTMGKIQPDGFTGIEIERPSPSEDLTDLSIRKRIGQLVSGEKARSTILVGPAETLETFQKDEEVLSALIHNS